MTRYPDFPAQKPYSSGDFHANMSIEAGTEIAKFNSPVHESMTIAALIASDFEIDRSITIYKLKDNPKAYPEINDFIRGVIWNDDPACEFFDDNDNNDNFDYSTGAMWLTYFLRGKFNPLDEHNITGRSHFGDLQFLHGMAAEKGEWPTDTRNNIMNYLELMYKLACGNVEVKPETEIQNTWLGKYFTAFSTPDKFYELRGLLTAYHKTPANVRHRALGSCFHVIQDSYTHGHTRRLLKNPEDQDTSSPTLKFKPGTRGKWGAVTNFHCYKGQDEDAHKKYDYPNEDMHKIDPTNLDQFNPIIGARDAVDMCIRLTNYWTKKTSWENGVRQFLQDTVFELASGATRSDDSVE